MSNRPTSGEEAVTMIYGLMAAGSLAVRSFPRQCVSARREGCKLLDRGATPQRAMLNSARMRASVIFRRCDWQIELWSS